MKIVCCYGDRGGCGYYRLILPYSSLKGHEITLSAFIDPPEARGADVIVVQRASTPEVITGMRRFKSNGQKIIMDFDDNLHTLPGSNPCAIIYGTGKPATRLFEQALEIADVVTCSTTHLASEYKRFRHDIKVCENYLDDANLEVIAPKEITGSSKREGQIRIGYTGSTTHAGDLTILRPLKKIAEAYPEAKLVFLGQEPPPGLPIMRVEWHGFVSPRQHEPAPAFMLRYYQAIKSLDLDIAVAPLESNTFNRCKSWVKLLEYGACGVPVVASKFGPYRDYGGSVLYATEEREWFSRLCELMHNSSLREALTVGNLFHVYQHGTISTGITKWKAILNDL